VGSGRQDWGIVREDRAERAGRGSSSVVNVDSEGNRLTPGFRPARAPLVLLALLGACVMMTPPQHGVPSSPAPTPEVIRKYPWMADVRWPGTAPRPTPKEELAIAEDIDRLLTGDFDVYPVAARRLIHRGPEVLPYLGHAADRHHAPAAHKARLTIVFWPVLRDCPEARVLLALSSPYPAVRATAASAAGERGLMELGGRLVALLKDPDVRVRTASITSLRMLTNEFLEYRPDAPASVRDEGVLRWQEYWRDR